MTDDQLNPAQLLTRREAATYLGVSHSSLARWAHLRCGPRYYLIGRRARYRANDLEAFAEGLAREPLRGPP